MSQWGKLTPSAHELNQLSIHSLESSVTFTISIAFLLLLLAARFNMKILLQAGIRKVIWKKYVHVATCNETDPITDKTSNAVNLSQEQKYSGAGWHETCPKSTKLSTCRKYTSAAKLEITLHYGDETSDRSMSNAMLPC